MAILIHLKACGSRLRWTGPLSWPDIAPLRTAIDPTSSSIKNPIQCFPSCLKKHSVILNSLLCGTSWAIYPLAQLNDNEIN